MPTFVQARPVELKNKGETMSSRCVITGSTSDARFWLAGLAAEQFEGYRVGLTKLSDLDRQGLRSSGVTDLDSELISTRQWLKPHMDLVRTIAERLKWEGMLDGERLLQLVDEVLAA